MNAGKRPSTLLYFAHGFYSPRRFFCCGVWPYVLDLSLDRHAPGFLDAYSFWPHGDYFARRAGHYCQTFDNQVQ